MSFADQKITIATPLASIRRIAPNYQIKLRKLGLKTVLDLLTYFPRRYDDFSEVKNIEQLFPDEIATIQGKISKIKLTKTWKKRIFITDIEITDSTGSAKAIWFNQPYLATTFKEGHFLSLSGKTKQEGKKIIFQNPSYEIIHDADQFLAHTARLVPVYPETKGLTSRWLRFQIKQFLPLIKTIPEFLPQQIIKRYAFPALSRALQEIHFPDSGELLEKSKKRLGFEEIFLIQLFLAKQRALLKKETAPKIEFDENLIRPFVESLPFKLTQNQRQSAWDVFKDMQKPSPMNRLLNGDVGSGKTIVAALCALQAVKKGWQAAFLVPTEVLAWQHYQTLTGLFKKSGFDIALLTHSQNRHFVSNLGESLADSKSILGNLIADNQIPLVIGTHALLQEKIKFKDLGLVIIDEQHRFGVGQRAKLLNSQKLIPHLLSMTATPIPRTLTLAIYGDLDISLLQQMPLGTREVKTQIVSQFEKPTMHAFISNEIKKGAQVFVICPRIEQGEEINQNLNQNQKSTILEMKAVETEYEKLKKIFPQAKVEKLHGRMKPKDKQDILEKMRNGEIDILVSTSVIEVGIDIPNASVLTVESAERFGLAQLHQFRGRIGRAGQKAYCFLVSETKNSPRLKAMAETNDGFKLAEYDLKIRGPGEFLGTQQWGFPELTMGSLADIKTVSAAQAEVQEILSKDPDLKNYPALAQKITDFGQKIHLE